jgi:hypothetical protein
VVPFGISSPCIWVLVQPRKELFALHLGSLSALIFSVPCLGGQDKTSKTLCGPLPVLAQFQHVGGGIFFVEGEAASVIDPLVDAAGSGERR